MDYAMPRILFFFGRPRFSLPAGMSQLCSLHFGQNAGRRSIRLTHLWPHRRQLQIMLAGIAICPIIINQFFS